jgi:AraC-like DNA-binding protein
VTVPARYSAHEDDSGLAMVKKRHTGGIEEVAFADRSLGVETVSLRALFAREGTHDLTQLQRPMFHHLVLATRGVGTYFVDFVAHRLQPGSVLHVAPGQVQRFPLEPRFDALLIVFQPQFVRIAAQPSSKLLLRGGRLQTVQRLFATVDAECRAFDGSERTRELLVRLVEAIGLAVTPQAEVAEPETLLVEFRAALEKSFTRAHEVAAYAAALGCSARTLTRHCERWAGRSAKRLIDERVTLEARRLLAHGSQPVAEISELLGFSEPTHFVKFFRRLLGETPGDFRRRASRRSAGRHGPRRSQ